MQRTVEGSIAQLEKQGLFIHASGEVESLFPHINIATSNKQEWHAKALEYLRSSEFLALANEYDQKSETQGTTPIKWLGKVIQHLSSISERQTKATD